MTLLKKLFTCIIFGFCFFSLCAQEKASDFFLDPSKEKDLLASLFEQNDKQNADEKGFKLGGEAGLLITSGNTDTQMLKMAFDSTHELEKWSNNYNLSFLQQQNRIRTRTPNVSRTTKTERIELNAQLDYKLKNPDHRLFAYFEFDDNQFNSLRDQITAVIGWSQIAWKEQSSSLRYSIGPGYSHFEQEQTQTIIDELIVRGSLFLDYSLSSSSQFKQSISAELGEQVSKASSTSSITAKLFEDLAMKFSVELIFNDSLSDQGDSLSTQTSITMVYQFF